jgi:hypothetical protein
MWERYRKTFVGMQVLIWAVCIGALLMFGPLLALVLLVVMQLSSVMGAVWGQRISVMAQRQAAGLPLRPVR